MKTLCFTTLATDDAPPARLHALHGEIDRWRVRWPRSHPLTPSQYSLHRFAPIFSNFFSVGDDPHNLLRSPRILGARLLSHFFQSFRDRWI